jgi:cytochrome P450
MSTGCPFHQPDPFEQARIEKGLITPDLDGDRIPMLLRFKDVKDAAKNPQKFTSEAFRVPIPSEEDVRRVKQLPVEANPPEHGPYRAIVEPFFHRPLLPEMIEKVDALIRELLGAATQADSIELVRQFALPLQSRALTYLLNVPESEATTWISWGVHVFRDGGDGKAKGATLDAYIESALDQAAAHPGEDFFSALTQATFQGRPLTREEMTGFANLTFAGGRDTIINSVSSIVALIAQDPKLLEYLRANPKMILSASEEFMRIISPLTHTGRVCPVDTDVLGENVPADQRVSLNWASANYDETVFAAPQEIRLDRKPNPHIAYGFGTHHCLGAPHARLVIRTLLRQLCHGVESIQILEATKNEPNEADFLRHVGYKSLTVKISPLATTNS